VSGRLVGRYLIAASSIPGHVTPLVEVGGDLSRRGHEVAVLTGAEYADGAVDRGLRALVVHASARPRRARKVPRGPALARRLACGRADLSSVFIEPMAAQSAALHDVLADEHFDAVLCDIGFTGALPMLLKGRPRPWIVACGVGPLTLSSLDTPPFGVGWQPNPFVGYRAMGWVVRNVLFGDVQARFDESLHQLGAPRSPVFVTDWPRLADRLLQFSVPALEYRRRDLPATVDFTGPVVPPVAASRRRSGHGTVVHVTQGTWDNLDLTELILPTLRGLAHRNDLHVVATTGGSGTMSALGDVPRNARVVDYLPYERLLPDVDAMVTNGGFGGVQHALLHGIPLVLAGDRSDKPEVAARVAYAGAGIDLRTSRPSPQAVADAVRRVLADPSYRRAAQRIAREMQCYNAFDSIADTLDGLSQKRLITE
jgi:UDP:flavonoid glycosyltransferase YjiC (YdhE family)